MRIGCCASIDDAAIVHEAGYDYIECRLTSLLGEEEDEAVFAPVLEQYLASPVPASAFNIFMPRAIKVTGTDVNRDKIQRYVQTALPRAKQVGGEMLVFGSGGSRNLVDGFPREQAMVQLTTFLQDVADVAEDVGITIAIEPLNLKESNIINSVSEGVELAERVDRPKTIRVLADFYHMDEDGEGLSNISKHKDWLAHIHVADTGRGSPGTGSYPYDVFKAEVDKAGYTGMISVECRWQDFAAEAGPSARFLRSVFG
ncbi:MAG: sugar phosphate isomerase/epimerase family protein [Chloroflexota bacterium]